MKTIGFVCEGPRDSDMLEAVIRHILHDDITPLYLQPEASLVGENGNAGQCNYSASKAGLTGLSKSIAKEMGPRGIRSNCIAPGFIATDMTEKVKEKYDTLIKGGLLPIKRWGTPEDVANACSFLASDRSSYISGQILGVDGCASI